MSRLKSASGIVALSAVFGALAYLIELTGVSHFLPFPPLNYLLYDPAEIVIYLLYLAVGLKPALLATILVVLGLSINIDSFSVLIMSCTGIPFYGPIMKGLAIASTLAGLALIGRRRWKLALCSAVILRVVLMTFPNLAFIILIIPSLPFPQSTIEWFTSNIIYILALTGAYNASQVLIAFLPAQLIYRRLLPGFIRRFTIVKKSKSQ
ncbi:MAG: hypothetical protein QXU47_00165 [Candidatus Bathyarchaeia archaeon]